MQYARSCSCYSQFWTNSSPCWCQAGPSHPQMLPCKWDLWHFAMSATDWEDCTPSADTQLPPALDHCAAVWRKLSRALTVVWQGVASCNPEASQPWQSQGLRHFLRQLGGPWITLRHFAAHGLEPCNLSSAASSSSSLHLANTVLSTSTLCSRNRRVRDRFWPTFIFLQGDAGA